MKRVKCFQKVVLGLTIVGLCIPRFSLAAAPTQAPAAPPASPVVADVVLHQGGTLVGNVVTPEYAAVGNVQVALYDNDRQIAASTTDANGRFKFTGLENGVYEIAAADGRGVYRAWQENVAPPAAQQSALVVNGSDVVRGQAPPGRSLRIPLVLAALVATAIAVPVAIYNSQDKKPASGD